MTAKEYMKQAKILLRRIDRKQKEADILRQKLSLPKSPAYSDMPKTVSPESHEIEVGIAKIMSLEEEVSSIIDAENFHNYACFGRSYKSA